MIYNYLPICVMRKLIIFSIFVVLFCGCSKSNLENCLSLSYEVEKDYSDVKIISQEEALSNLRSFMEVVEHEMPPTKSGFKRRIGNVDTYYISNPTKSVETMPAAYIVNFENYEGFAVLGANSKVADIVAVTESGYLDPVTFAIRDSLDMILPEPFDPIVFDEDAIPFDFDWYCEEDDDYYICSPPNLNNIKDYIRAAVHVLDDSAGSSSGGGNNLFPGDDGSDNGIGVGGMVNTRPYVEQSALLKTNWNQGNWQEAGVYNKYCIKNNGKVAYAGCSITSCAMILAYNAFPQNLKVNNILLNYSEMTAAPSPYNLDYEFQEHVSLLMGGMFNSIDRLFAFSCGTCITPRQIELFMKDMGYTNVIRNSASEFDDSMLYKISAMLNNKLPVFISAFRGPVDGHSWVIDGSVYTEDDTYCLHCNWGWSGSCNGYFSYTCFQPNSPIFSDGNGHNDDGSEYDRRFRVITYNKPTVQITRRLEF